MKISIATTWNSACGISDYSKNLVDEFIKKGHEIEILGSEVFPLLFEDESFVKRMGIPDKPDILHLQYSSFIFKREYYDKILRVAKAKGAKCCITFHDQHLYPGVNYDLIDVAIAHRDDVFNFLPDNIIKEVIPFGIPNAKVKIVSFGLGRNMEDKIEPICSNLGFGFEVSSFRDWKRQEELIKFIKSGDGVVLWYPENKGAGSSSAARYVIGARRPLFVNNCEWFKELNGYPDVYFSDSLVELEAKLKVHFNNVMIDEYNWSKIAEKHLEIYKGVI